MAIPFKCCLLYRLLCYHSISRLFVPSTHVATAGAEVGDAAESKADAMSLPKSCKDKFFSVAPPSSDPDEMRTYIVLLRRYSTSRAALRVAATLQRLARTESETNGVRVGELSVMGSGEPSLVVETTVAGVRVVSPALYMEAYICYKVCVCVRVCFCVCLMLTHIVQV